MTGEQIREICTAVPFRPFEMFLADGRTLEVEQPDLIYSGADGRVVRLYTRPDCVEIIDLLLVVSVRFRNASIFDDSILES